MREIHIVGNWKMNQKLEAIQGFFVEMTKMKMELRCHAWIAPQFIHFPILKELAFTTGSIQIGVQNCSSETNGAYTGEVSAEALQDMGSHFVIVGHSERRQIFKETDEVLYKKTRQVLKHKMKVIFCVGETLEERESGKTFEVIEKQIFNGLFDQQKATYDLSEWNEVMIAYEPVWAIGTGRTATSLQAEEVHSFIRKLLLEKFKMNAHETIILYGGSVKPENIHEILNSPNIDGALVGGASLKASDFKQLCMAGSQIRK